MLDKYVIKTFDGTKPRNEAWQVVGFTYAENLEEAWEKAELLYPDAKIEQIVRVDEWLE